MQQMNGKVCIVTGANAGIGKETALGLAEAGATVVMVCRNPQKGEAVRREIIDKSGNKNVDLLIADLSSQSEIRRLAAEIDDSYERIDVLVNNAGAVLTGRRLTADGLEYTFALNHLGYFLLTNLLLDKIIASAPARIVNVSSDASMGASLDFDNLQGEKNYSAFGAYSQSKLANVLFSNELARRLAGTAVTSNALHPGVVRTNFGRSTTNFLLGALIRVLGVFMIGPKQGAETSLYLAMSPEVEGVSGNYFANKRAKKPNGIALDTAVAKRLWKVSERLTDLTEREKPSATVQH